MPRISASLIFFVVAQNCKTNKKTELGDIECLISNYQYLFCSQYLTFRGENPIEFIKDFQFAQMLISLISN